jgi:hypothetical protein
MKDTPQNYEMHPLFPSGEWEGFYTYLPPFSNFKGQMSFYLLFYNQVVEGEGIDEVGRFAWKGSYDTQSMTCQMTKHYYGKHTVYYDGQVDENGIWGTWKITQGWSGGFHIRPKTAERETMETAIANLVEQSKKETVLVF